MSKEERETRRDPCALVVEDDRASGDALTRVVRRAGFEVARASTLATARDAVLRTPPDLVLVDCGLPDGDGLDLVEEIGADADTDVVVVTGNVEIDAVVRAMRAGAVDYLPKPVDVHRLEGVLERTRRTLRLRGEIGDLRRELRRLGRFGPMVGASAKMQEVYDLLERVGHTDATVLLTGETGTGKELAAATIHRLSRRGSEPFLPVNCGAVAPSLIESELFGHVKGAFTGADRARPGIFRRAHGGTLFLDEITEMPGELQVKLLRALETGRVTPVGGSSAIDVDVRVVAATNRDPHEAATEGKLREDLLYRLAVFPIRIPPLRERTEDIELLARHFLDVLNETEGTSKRFTEDALARLREHDWPGNIRELRNVVRRAFILSDDRLDAGVVHLTPRAGSSSREQDGPAVRIPIGSSIERAEKKLILATLEHFDSEKKRAAEALGISLKTLYNRLKRYEGRD